ncbi:hypothetical protein B0H13DRAFT_1888210 [Mycena leptocephala]|nr:hypothetical protein B0H13DRAFT_1888210 [Mycena leptocephala]
MAGCIKEWQQHCVLGVHPHPADPRGASQEVRATAGPAKSRARPVEPTLQAELAFAFIDWISKRYCLPDLSGLTLDTAGQNLRALSETGAPTDSTSISSVATTWPEVPEASRYYAIWGEAQEAAARRRTRRSTASSWGTWRRRRQIAIWLLITGKLMIWDVIETTWYDHKMCEGVRV